MSSGKEERRRAREDELDKQSLLTRVLLLIPKNLVYVFLLVILGSFVAMSYITYTEKNLTEFLVYNRTREEIVINPLFVSLQKSMTLDEGTVAERSKSITDAEFS